MYHVRPAHSENWIFFTFDIRICCTVHGKCIPRYINLEEMSSIGPLMRNRQCSGTLHSSIYQYRNYVFGTTWYIPVHTCHIPCCTNTAVFIQVVETPDAAQYRRNIDIKHQNFDIVIIRLYPVIEDFSISTNAPSISIYDIEALCFFSDIEF